MSHFLTKPIGKYTIFRKKKKALHADIEEARPTIPGGLPALDVSIPSYRTNFTLLTVFPSVTRTM